jgi:transitional endoplasmic reticulum ATPase
MTKRITKEKIYITLPEETIKKIESMVATWTYDTKAFVRSRLNQYKAPSPLISSLKELFHLIFFLRRKKKTDECAQ